MKDNIYIKALEIGFESQTTGISFNEIVSELGIEESLCDEMFKFSFMTWFYTNFYNIKAERNLVQNPHGAFIHNGVIDKLEDCKNEKSFIKGDSIQKYNDYLELKETREASQIARKSSQSAEKYSQSARRFAFASIFIAIAAIIIPYITPEHPKQVIVTENRDKTDDAAILERLTKIDSTINNTISKLSLIAEKKVDLSVKKQGKPKVVKSLKH